MQVILVLNIFECAAGQGRDCLHVGQRRIGNSETGDFAALRQPSPWQRAFLPAASPDRIRECNKDRSARLPGGAAMIEVISDLGPAQRRFVQADSREDCRPWSQSVRSGRGRVLRAKPFARMISLAPPPRFGGIRTGRSPTTPGGRAAGGPGLRCRPRCAGSAQSRFRRNCRSQNQHSWSMSALAQHLAPRRFALPVARHGDVKSRHGQARPTSPRRPPPSSAPTATSATESRSRTRGTGCAIRNIPRSMTRMCSTI